MFRLRVLKPCKSGDFHNKLSLNEVSAKVIIGVQSSLQHLLFLNECEIRENHTFELPLRGHGFEFRSTLNIFIQAFFRNCLSSVHKCNSFSSIKTFTLDSKL